ncbi:olfactomedin-like protein 3B [Corythoichthys intestinalis]|uniref:olfactomedin-like protein 3B n=1 Tax=Corythoichthys intestinalis TaxID=161448 RepID=UPI0025A5C031|nr:olfactomedin-like protein 3B [Corythoichthys intestinalis]XP_061803646.1 olfactomedin-like protein 3B [Nerophis lumbriciformis]
MKPVFILLFSATWMQCGAQLYYQALMDYLENRLLAIEDHMHVWQEQARQYHVELQHLHKQSKKTMEGLNKTHSALSTDAEAAAVRMDRVERNMDLVESQMSPRACAKQADRVIEQGVWSQEESREDEEEDWQELSSSVTDCVEIVSSLRSVKILKRVGSSKGVWLRDPRSSKVYVFNGTMGDTIYQFKSVKEFLSSGVSLGHPIKLQSDWSGAGVAVYNGFLYYIQQGEDMHVVRYDLLLGEVTDVAILPVQSLAAVYSLNPETVADLTVDDQGLWLLYAGDEDEPNINLAKMDPVSLDIEQIWDTRCPRENSEAAFIVCGVVYVVYNTRLASRSRIQCVFDVNDKVVSEEAPLFYFPRRYGSHASLKYNPDEKQIYSWDDGYQILYRLKTKRKLLV